MAASELPAPAPRPPTGERRRGGWWRRRSLRARVTALATGVLALALVATSALLLLALRASLLSTVDATAEQRARDVVALVDQGRVPDVVPVVGEGVAVVQVLDPAGRVVAASPTASRSVPLLSPAEVDAARDGAPRFLAGDRTGDALPLRVVVRGSADGGSVVAGASVSAVQESLRAVRLALLAGVPLLLLGLAAATWAVVGSALRPVEALREGAEAVPGARPAPRLPVPAARDEVRRLALTLNGMLDRVDAAAARQRDFVADAAHELRSPLAGLRAQLEVTLAHPSAEPWPETARTLLDEVLRLGRLVDDLLVLARLDAGSDPRAESVRPRPRRTPVDLAALARAAVAATARAPGADRPGADRLGVDRPAVDVRAHARPVLVAGDREALRRVVDNLLDNALRHAATSVAVTVAAPGGPADVELTVDDDGPGVRVDERDRVFERFARVDGTRSRGTGGTGLGLAIVKELVQAHGGTVRAEEAPGGGARFVVALPAFADSSGGSTPSAALPRPTPEGADESVPPADLRRHR